MIFFLWGPGPLGCAVAVTWGLLLLAPCGTPEGRGSCVQARAAQPGVGRRFMARIPKERGCVCPSPSGSTGDLQVPLAVRWGRNLLDPWVTPSWSWRRQFSFSVYKTFAFSAALHLLPTLPRQQDAQLCPHSTLLPLAGDLFPSPPRWLLGPPSQDTATTGTPSPAPSSARGSTELSRGRRGCRLRCWESRSAITQIKSHCSQIEWAQPSPAPTAPL